MTVDLDNMRERLEAKLAELQTHLNDLHEGYRGSINFIETHEKALEFEEAASDLATSYLQEAATVNDRRRAGAGGARWRRPPTWSTGRRRSAGSGRPRGAAISRRIARPWGAPSRASGGRGTNQTTRASPPARAPGRQSQSSWPRQVHRSSGTALIGERRRPASPHCPLCAAYRLARQLIVRRERSHRAWR